MAIVIKKIKKLFTSKESATEHLVKGHILHIQQEYRKAIKEYTQAIEINPELDEAYIMRSNCYLILKEFDLMLNDLDKAIEVNPTNIESRLDRSKQYLAMEEYEAAIEDLSVAIRLFETGQDTSLDSKVAKKEFENKKEFMKKFHMEMSLAYIRRGQLMNMISFSVEEPKKIWSLSLKDFEKALKLDPKSVSAYIGKATSYQAMKKIDQAIKMFKKAIPLSITPEEKGLTINGLAAIYLELNKVDEALKLLNEGVKVDPEYYAIYLHRGACYVSKGMKKKAIADFKKCLELKPVCEEARQNLDFVQDGMKAKKKK